MIRIKYFNEDYPRLEKLSRGDWIDLRADESVSYKKGDIIKVRLGVAMRLPEGYEALLAPRSSTFKHWGLIQTNSVGVIDNSYNGNDDEWQVQFLATRDGKIDRFNRICQFRVLKNQPSFGLVEVSELSSVSRGGYGISGKGGD